MPRRRKYQPPESSTGDAAHLLATGVMSMIPGLPELFQYLVTPPLEKRRQKWMEDIGKGLRNLERNHNIRLEKLQSNDAFIDTVLHATQIAVRNSQEEKLEALRNAVLNAALPNPPDESLQLIFLDFVDTFTVWHLRLLRFLQNIKGWFKENGKRVPSCGWNCPLDQLIFAAFPELEYEEQFRNLLFNDLRARGLIRGMIDMQMGIGPTEKEGTAVIGDWSYKLTTSLGDKFLRFITTVTTK